MKYGDIFRVINFGRADYFSRSIHEAYEEVETNKSSFPNLAVEKKILLVYPFALFAFTSKENKEFAETIEKSFIKAYDDGIFIPFFYKHPHIKAALKQADSENRNIIEISNPFLTKETSAIPARYWHSK